MSNKKDYSKQELFDQAQSLSPKNKSIDKMAEKFTSLEELQAYCDSQYKTILTLNSKINSQEKELEKLREANTNLQRDLAISGAGRKEEGQFATSDEETTCVIQLAMLKANAMQRELIMDEVKRLEILSKVLQMVRNQNNKKEKDNTDGMSPEELLKQLEGLSKETQ